jgi:hypothetical protein
MHSQNRLSQYGIEVKATTTIEEILCFKNCTKFLGRNNLHSYLGIGLITHAQPLDNVVS